MQPAARYREYVPCPALREHVRRLFTFVVPASADEPLRRPWRERWDHDSQALRAMPMFADSHVSICFSFGPDYRINGLWDGPGAKTAGHIIGPMSAAHAAAHGERVIQVGAYLRAAQARSLAGPPAGELTDRILPLAACWGEPGRSLEARIAEEGNDDQRVHWLETALLERLRGSSPHRSGMDLKGLAAYVQKKRGGVTAGELADAAGVSRQHLGRIFQQEIGVSPKLFCRLARFRAALTCAGRGMTGAGLAADLGYVDQSHMIAEFREFSGLTPRPLMRLERVHPFMDFTAEARG